jgi:microsomal dipeptidase-like Zn-dependent dipeptidase
LTKSSFSPSIFFSYPVFVGKISPPDKISKLPDLTKALLKRGCSERDVKKILGGNFKRVFKEVTS